jgi:CDP-glucose 4,6-dehydratase
MVGRVQGRPSPSGFWLDRRVLVTGCAGFLGSWLTAALVDTGAAVVGLVRDEIPFSELRRSGYRERIAAVRGDVTDYELLERTLNEYEIDTVFHLAAQTIVPIANRAPLSTLETNIKGTWVLLEAARRSPRVSRVLVASSDKAYGVQPRLPYTEDMALQGCFPYDVSKSCATLVAQAYATTFGLPVSITCCANLYGGGDLNWSRLVPDTVRKLIRGERPVIRSDGTMLRDYLYVEDAVGAYLTLAEQMERAEVRGQLFNFGSDAPRSVLDVVQTIVALFGRPDLDPIVLCDAPNEIPAQYLDSGKARRILAWSPSHSFEDGLSRTLAWYREFLSVPTP